MRKNNSSHSKTEQNLLRFTGAFNASEATVVNLLAFFRQITSEDEEERTEFELSFKVRDEIVHKGEIRLLNIDAEGYSYKSQTDFLKRLLLYKKIMWHKTSCPQKKRIFTALQEVAKTPLDLYGGADIFEKDFLFAFWLILGGVEKNGRVKFAKNADLILKNTFSSLGIMPAYKVDSGDVLNIGFDLDQKKAFYKIYYILNKETEKFINRREKAIVDSLEEMLGKSIRHWFFVSERYIIGENKRPPGRKKIYLEFLDPILTADDGTYDLLEKIFKLIGCPYGMVQLRKTMGVLDGRIIIIAFEEDGTVTFYIRI